MTEPLPDVDRLPEGWITLTSAYQFLRERAAVDGSSFIQHHWGCKYVNARVDMRTGRVLLTPGNVSSATPRTANEWKFNVPGEEGQFVRIEFAQQLERELAEMEEVVISRPFVAIGVTQPPRDGQ